MNKRYLVIPILLALMSLKPLLASDLRQEKRYACALVCEGKSVILGDSAILVRQNLLLKLASYRYLSHNIKFAPERDYPVRASIADVSQYISTEAIPECRAKHKVELYFYPVSPTSGTVSVRVPETGAVLEHRFVARRTKLASPTDGFLIHDADTGVSVECGFVYPNDPAFEVDVRNPEELARLARVVTSSASVPSAGLAAGQVEIVDDSAAAPPVKVGGSATATAAKTATAAATATTAATSTTANGAAVTSTSAAEPVR